MRTTVIHIKDAPQGWRDNPTYVYIGRGNNRQQLPRSKWHNPFRMRNESERPLVIEQFRQYLPDQPDLIANLYQLEGKILVCHCSPRDCHGHVLVELLEHAVE